MQYITPTGIEDLLRQKQCLHLYPRRREVVRNGYIHYRVEPRHLKAIQTLLKKITP